jgi:hypothetical protein
VEAHIFGLSLRQKISNMSDAMQYTIKDNHVFVPATAWFAERCIAAITESNKDYIVTSLQDRFKGLEEKVAEIEARFGSEPDTTRLGGLIARTRTYICTAIAIGDYAALLGRLDLLGASLKESSQQAAASKEALCAEAEQLLAGDDSKEATQKMKALVQQFRDLPAGHDDRSLALKRRFDKAKDAFFKRRQGVLDAQEQEMEANLLAKVAICEQAEALQQSGDWKAATDAYQQLNEEWKKIGLVPRHRKEELWLRFNTAKDVFFARKKGHYEHIKTEQDDNYTKKLALVEKAEALQNSNEWKKTTDAFKALMDEWKQLGWAGQERGDEVWKRFMAAQDLFYKNKDAHYGQLRVELEDNYARKMALVVHAEALQHSEDFDGVTLELNEMMDEWKTIGRLAKEHGDGPWERFLAARRHFFDRKDAYRLAHKSGRIQELNERIGRERGLLNKLGRRLSSDEQLIGDINDRIANLPTSLRSYQKREEYLETLEGLKNGLEELRQEMDDLRHNIQQDERELRFLQRPPKAKGKEEGQPATAEAPAAPLAPTADEGPTEETTEETAIAEPQSGAVVNGTNVAEDAPAAGEAGSGEEAHTV